MISIAVMIAMIFLCIGGDDWSVMNGWSKFRCIAMFAIVEVTVFVISLEIVRAKYRSRNIRLYVNYLQITSLEKEQAKALLLCEQKELVAHLTKSIEDLSKNEKS